MQKLKVIFQIFLVIVFLTMIVFVQLKYSNHKKGIKYSGLRVNIADSSSLGFISKGDIAQKMGSYNLKRNVTLLKDVPLAAIELLFKNNPYLNRAQVYSDITGHINIDIEQFIPKMRIIDSDGISYFVDDKYKIVQQRHYINMPIPVVTQSGDVIPLRYLMNFRSADTLNDRQKLAYRRIDLLYNFMEQVDETDILKTLITQVNINNSEEIELIPRIGNHLIIFCGIDSLVNCEKYIDKMKIFYNSQSNNGVWTQYSRVNFKFSGQVVCKKIKNI